MKVKLYLFHEMDSKICMNLSVSRNGQLDCPFHEMDIFIPGSSTENESRLQLSACYSLDKSSV